MNPVEPALHENAMRRTFAKDQPEYIPLPASVDADSTVMTEWEPTAEELDILLRGGRVRLWLLHTGVSDDPPRPLTPIMLQAVAAS